MAAFQIAPSETFDCASPDTWPVWIRRFERFRTASGLEEKDGKIQISTLVYAMGPKAEEILSSFTLTEEQVKSYNEVRSKFDTHFVAQRNMIFERAKFINVYKNQRSRLILLSLRCTACRNTACLVTSTMSSSETAL